MDLHKDRCDGVLEWLAGRDPVDHATFVPRPLLEHVQGCEDCRARLYVALRSLGFERLPAPPGACEPCRADLAAFVEAERRDPLRALRRYPYVREHLWVCPACLEAYDYLSAVVAEPPVDLLAEAKDRLGLAHGVFDLHRPHPAPRGPVRAAATVPRRTATEKVLSRRGLPGMAEPGRQTDPHEVVLA